MQPSPPIKRPLSEPFAWIILGAVLVFGASIGSGAFSLVLFATAFSPSASSFGEVLLPVVFAFAFVSPVGSFILLAGLARAVRPLRPTASQSSPGGIDRAFSTPPRSRIAWYRIAFVGAVINLIGGLGAASVDAVRAVFPPTGQISDYGAYFLGWAIVTVVAVSIAAVGSFLAFVGVGLAVRDGWP